MKLTDEQLDQMQDAFSNLVFGDNQTAESVVKELQLRRRLAEHLIPYHPVVCDFYQDPTNGQCTCGLQSILSEIDSL